MAINGSRRGDDNDDVITHQERNLGSAVEEYLPYERALVDVELLEGLGGDELALRQLEHVLPAIDDLDLALSVRHADVARAEEAVGGEVLGTVEGVVRVGSERLCVLCVCVCVQCAACSVPYVALGSLKYPGMVCGVFTTISPRGKGLSVVR